MFALLIFMPRFKSIIFYQNSPKIKLFMQKNAKFSSVEGSAPRPPASGGWGLSSWTFDGFRRLRYQTPKTASPISNFGYRRLNVVWICSANKEGWKG